METEKDVYLLEINLQNLNNKFYFLYFMGRNEPDFVLKKQNKIILTHKKTKKFYLLLLKYFGTDNLNKCVDAKINVSETFDTVLNEDMSKRGKFITVWNTIFDMISIEQSPIPIEYKEEFYEFMDFMTFESSKTKIMFDERRNLFNKNKVLDSMYWCIGYFISNSILYVIEDLNPELFDNFPKDCKLNFICP